MGISANGPNNGWKGASRLTINELTSGIQEKWKDPVYQLTCEIDSHQHMLELSLAETDEEKRRVFSIRHKAYCGEGNPLPAQPDGLERDEYDRDALHVLARLDGVPVGTVRTTFMYEGRFLIETFEEKGVPAIKIPAYLPREETAEPSRLAIDKAFVPPCVYRPLITIALHHRNYRASVDAGMRFWVLEPNERNLRLLRRLRWRMYSLGQFHHHGQAFEAFWMPLLPSHFNWALDAQP